MGIGTMYGADGPRAVQDSAVSSLRRTRGYFGSILAVSAGLVAGEQCDRIWLSSGWLSWMMVKRRHLD